MSCGRHGWGLGEVWGVYGGIVLCLGLGAESLSWPWDGRRSLRAAPYLLCLATLLHDLYRKLFHLDHREVMGLNVCSRLACPQGKPWLLKVRAVDTAQPWPTYSTSSHTATLSSARLALGTKEQEKHVKCIDCSMSHFYLSRVHHNPLPGSVTLDVL